MSHQVLFVEASPRGGLSVSTTLAEYFVDQLRKVRADVQVDRLRLWDETLPDLDGDLLAAKYAILSKTPLSQQQSQAWGRLVRLIERLRGADRVVIATPLWNFGTPYKLKHWIDLVTQPGESFTFDPKAGYAPLLPPRPVTIVLASSGDYSAGPSWGRADLASPYLREALGFIGLTGAEVVLAGPMAGDPERQDIGRQAARRRLAKLAAQQGSTS